jgi:hypothetical protein
MQNLSTLHHPVIEILPSHDPSRISGEDSVSIGVRAYAEGPRSIAIGPDSHATLPDQVVIGTHDVGEMCARIKKLEAAMALLQEQFEQVWYAPGMPGTAEAQEDFEGKTK